MRVRKYWKKSSCCLMAGMLAVGLWGCGQSKEDIPSEAMSTQMEQIQKSMESAIANQVNIEDYLKEGVTLPEHYENMIFPLEALAVEYYSQSYPYYTEGENEDSFWFSMAVLSSLMSENGYTHPEYKAEHNFFSKDEIDLYADALYHQYALDTWPLPEFREDSPYVTFEEDSQRYGLLVGNIGDLSISVSGCKPVEDGYEIRFQLVNQESNRVLSEYVSTICPEDNSGKERLFEASVNTFSEINEAELVDENANQPEDDIVNILDSFDADETVDEDSLNVEEEVEEDPDEALQDRLMIDRSEALSLANSYIGDGASCTYKQLITIGDCKYYDFELKGERLTHTDVLVSINGMDVFLGLHNSDGSWTFD